MQVRGSRLERVLEIASSRKARQVDSGQVQVGSDAVM